MLKSILGYRLLQFLSPDANTDSTSSNESDANGEDSSTQEQDDKQESGEEPPPEGDESQDDQTDEEDETEDKGDESSDEADGADDQEEKGQEQQQEEAPAVVDKPEDEKLEFHKHPRFQELIQEKNAVRQELESLKPLAERTKILDDYVAKNNIRPEQLTNALEYTRLINTDPMKAYELLKPVFNQLATYAGDVLPVDLQEEVTAGTLPVQRAKEIAQARAQRQYADWQGQNRGQTQQQQQEQQIQGSIDAWAKTKMQTDADLRPKQNGQPDGKWEYLDMKLRSLRQANPPATSQKAIELVEQAYAETQKFFKRFKVTANGKQQKPPLRSSQNNQNTTGVLPTDPNKATAAIVAAVLSGKKPHQMRYAK